MQRTLTVEHNQVNYIRAALRNELTRRRASIARADANRKAGGTIQWGTYEGHLNAIAALTSLIDQIDGRSSR